MMKAMNNLLIVSLFISLWKGLLALPADASLKANALIDKMTLEEKITLLHGSSSPAYVGGGSYVGFVPGNTRLVIICR